MDRSIVYTQEQGRSTDFLFAQRSAMIGLAKLSEALFGTSTFSSGLVVIPTSPASLSVYVNPGQIYAYEDIDATAYGILAADTTHQILKQGLLLDQATLTMVAPTTSGYSINYLIQAAFAESDTNNVVLPYFNSANPSQPLSGQSNSGAPQATERQDLVTLVAKAGTAAATGTQTTPSPDSGYIGLAVVTIAYGQTTITSGNISVYSGAPVVPAGGAFASSRSSILYLPVDGNTDVILDAEGQARYPIIFMTGAVTGNANLIVPTGLRGRWIILNATTGSFTRTVKTSAGTGIVVPQGTSMLVYCDGTYVYNATSSALTQTDADARYLLAKPGAIITFAGSTIPSGYLQIPTAATNISRTTYAALFAEIGTIWGAGDGSTTFGLPYIPTGYTLAQATLALQSVGQVIAHTHSIPLGITSSPYNTTSGTANGAATGATGSTGGSANLAASVGFNFAIKY
ncbi:MAG TPA: phage tail protein [Burkholderiales bacterium]|nr:phage tail protein [Burkholderiales bacterium]